MLNVGLGSDTPHWKALRQWGLYIKVEALMLMSVPNVVYRWGCGEPLDAMHGSYRWDCGKPLDAMHDS